MPVVNTLKEIQAFLASNPSEIISIFIEDYVKDTKVFTEAYLMKYWYLPCPNMVVIVPR